MDAYDKMHIDALLHLEKMGLMNWTDKAQLDNYRQVYPQYFLSEKGLDRSVECDAFPNK